LLAEEISKSFTRRSCTFQRCILWSTNHSLLCIGRRCCKWKWWIFQRLYATFAHASRH